MLKHIYTDITFNIIPLYKHICRTSQNFQTVTKKKEISYYTFFGTERSYSYLLALHLTPLLLMQTESKILLKIKKKACLTYILLRRGRPLNLLPANLQYWGLHSQRAVYIVHCRHFSFLQLPFVLPNKIHIWYIIHGTVSLKTTEGRQRAIQLSMVTGLSRRCQVYSLRIWSIIILREDNTWYRKSTKYVVILKGLRPEVLLILSWPLLNKQHFLTPRDSTLVTPPN